MKFSLQKPSIDAIARKQAAVQRRPAFAFGVETERVPFPFIHDQLRTTIGKGRDAFLRSIALVKAWQHVDLGWARVVDDKLRIEEGALLGLVVHSLGLWSVNFSEIVKVINEENMFGYVYRTSYDHIECGEERFLLMFEEETEVVSYELCAFSKPTAILAWMGYPVTRAFQSKFARGSTARMQTLLANAGN